MYKTHSYSRKSVKHSRQTFNTWKRGTPSLFLCNKEISDFRLIRAYIYIYIRTLLWNSRTWQEFRVIHMLLCFRNNGTVMQNTKYLALSKNVCRQVCGKWAIVKRENTWVCQSRSKVRRKQSCEARLRVTLRVYPPCGMLLFLSHQLLSQDQKNIYWGHTAKECRLVYP